MSASWKIASMLALPLSLALAGTGCVAQSADDTADTDAVTADDAQQPVEAAQADETGEAQQACGFGHCGGFGFGFGRGCGGFGFARPFGGFGCGGFGYGLPFGGYGYGCGGYARPWGGYGGCW